ncbi:MAG: hypothetical protein QM760_20750 [Nibricoccus sp.]
MSRGDSKLASVEYVAVGRKPSRETKLGRFSIDMARVGVVELAPLLASHDGDREQLSEWSAEAADERPTSWGGRLKSGAPHAVFFDIGGDCEVDVFRIFDGREVIGFRLCPGAPKKVEARFQKWTWVEVKMRGMGDPWSFCDDWNYEPDDDLIYDGIETALSWSHKIPTCPDVPLQELSPKIKGVEWIKVYTEEAVGQELELGSRKKLKLKIPTIPRFPTASQLRKVVFELYKEARKAV